MQEGQTAFDSESARAALRRQHGTMKTQGFHWIMWEEISRAGRLHSQRLRGRDKPGYRRLREMSSLSTEQREEVRMAGEKPARGQRLGQSWRALWPRAGVRLHRKTLTEEERRELTCALKRSPLLLCGE